MANKKSEKKSVKKSVYVKKHLYDQCLLVLQNKDKSFNSYLNSMLERQLASFRSANGIDPSVEITKELIDELNEKLAMKNAT